MRALPRTALALAFTFELLTGSVSSRAEAASSAKAVASSARAIASSSFRSPIARKVVLKGPGAKVAVQPFDGPNSEPLRGLVVRIVRDRGFRPVTSLPKYEGTGQYPVLAKDHRLAAFVTADMAERGRWQSITFLVWNGVSGTIVGRWTASAPSANLSRAVGRGFWARLGPAIRKAQAPRSADDMAPAAPMRIDASDQEQPDTRHFAERR